MHEYLVMKAQGPISEKQLNELGDEGWLLCTTYPSGKFRLFVFSKEKQTIIPPKGEYKH